MQLCIEYSADINAQDEDNGGSPLMYAIHNAHDHVVDALLQLGAGMDLYEQQGYTPLMVACLSDNAAACERLLAHKTVLDQTDSKGRTALSMACRCGAAPGSLLRAAWRRPGAGIVPGAKGNSQASASDACTGASTRCALSCPEAHTGPTILVSRACGGAGMAA